jgi:hypothetical protein
MGKIIRLPVLEVIDKVINRAQRVLWGYAPEYYLSSAKHCTPSYASHFYNKHMLPLTRWRHPGMIAEKADFLIRFMQRNYIGSIMKASP